MASSCCGKRPRPAVPLLLVLLLVVSCALSVSASGGGRGNGTRTAEFRSGDELRAYQSIVAQMDRMKKASVKTIQSADGDIIHCVPAHLQPAFDHPTLRGQKPEPEPEERPKTSADAAEEEGDAVFPQAWSDGGESCPGGTVPIRRTTESDLRRHSGSLRRYGMKPRAAGVRRDSTSDGHERGGVRDRRPVLRRQGEPERVAGQGGVGGGVQPLPDLGHLRHLRQRPQHHRSRLAVSPQLYGDNSPRFFTYWTSDAYQATGCYNLHCSGFVQTNRRIAIGAAISPASAYNGRQFDISLLIWKDPRRGHWWLQLGSGPLVGYWPSSLFSHLGGHANMVQFGGEVVNTRPSGSHTPTQMGSGHFPREGFNRAAYFRNVQVVDWDNNLLPARDLRLVADHPACYGIQGGYNRAWGNYFYYGGPGRNVHCP
ncbi:unnamed protein product [Triticum turgidum subsp. durum]|uniref:Neprosin PEP catalytic domain-containing protein n=1 Tax=Triticum turgidum subsp. durum TaxID=4567 RepID=A0A9R0RCW5_TRITD|nr:unnamed protein product [Triticum turgidum subsp. durum]